MGQGGPMPMRASERRVGGQTKREPAHLLRRGGPHLLAAHTQIGQDDEHSCHSAALEERLRDRWWWGVVGWGGGSCVAAAVKREPPKQAPRPVLPGFQR